MSTATVTKVLVTDRNAWVTFADAYPACLQPEERERLVSLAAEVSDLANPEGFPFGYSFTPFSQDRSLLIALHRVDPES